MISIRVLTNLGNNEFLGWITLEQMEIFFHKLVVYNYPFVDTFKIFYHFDICMNECIEHVLFFFFFLIATSISNTLFG